MPPKRILTSRLKRRTRPATTGSSVDWPVNLRRTNGAVPAIHWSCNSKCSNASGGKPGAITLRLREALEKLMEEGLP